MGETHQLPVKSSRLGTDPFQGTAEVVYLVADIGSRSRFFSEVTGQFPRRLRRPLVRSNKLFCDGNGFLKWPDVLIDIGDKVLGKMAGGSSSAILITPRDCPLWGRLGGHRGAILKDRKRL